MAAEAKNSRFLVQKRCPKTSKMDPQLQKVILRKCARHPHESTILGDQRMKFWRFFPENGVRNGHFSMIFLKRRFHENVHGMQAAARFWRFWRCKIWRKIDGKKKAHPPEKWPPEIPAGYSDGIRGRVPGGKGGEEKLNEQKQKLTGGTKTNRNNFEKLTAS